MRLHSEDEGNLPGNMVNSAVTLPLPTNTENISNRFAFLLRVMRDLTPYHWLARKSGFTHTHTRKRKKKMSQKDLSSKTCLPLEKLTLKYYIPDISVANCICIEAAGFQVIWFLSQL